MTYVTEQSSAELREHMRRLRQCVGWHEPLADRLFKEIEDQDERIAKLEAALKPFADFADPSAVVPPTIEITHGSRIARRQLTMGDCYEAARALHHEQTARGET